MFISIASKEAINLKCFTYNILSLKEPVNIYNGNRAAGKLCEIPCFTTEQACSVVKHGIISWENNW